MVSSQTGVGRTDFYTPDGKCCTYLCHQIVVYLMACPNIRNFAAIAAALCMMTASYTRLDWRAMIFRFLDKPLGVFLRDVVSSYGACCGRIGRGRGGRGRRVRRRHLLALRVVAAPLRPWTIPLDRTNKNYTLKKGKSVCKTN